MTETFPIIDVRYGYLVGAVGVRKMAGTDRRDNDPLFPVTWQKVYDDDRTERLS